MHRGGYPVGFPRKEPGGGDQSSILIDMGRIDDLKRATQNRAYQEQLMAELLPDEIQNAE